MQDGVYYAGLADAANQIALDVVCCIFLYSHEESVHKAALSEGALLKFCGATVEESIPSACTELYKFTSVLASRKSFEM